MICAAGLAVLAAVSCCKGSDKVTAIVAGPENAVVALDIEYDAPICPASICPEAFEVEGHEVACVKACKEGHVFVLLKSECCKEGKPECAEAKPECDKKCEEAKACCEQEKACCKEEGAECCDKPECCKEDDKPCCKEGKPACAEKAECTEKAECDEKPECEKECKIAVPKISVKQVADIKDVNGKVIPAWKKALKAGDVEPICAKKAGCEKPACDKPCEKPCEKECE